MMRFQRTLVCGVALSICISLAAGQRADIPKEAIKVQIKIDRNKFQLGEEIVFIVIISNVGTQPFLIPNQMTFGAPSHGSLDFEVRNQSDNMVAPTVGWAFDCLDYKPTKLLYETILNDYLLLRPGASYVQQTSLGGLYNDLKPGTYHLKARYSASFSPLGCQQWTTEDVEKFPFQAWYGTTAVNDISFTILPNSKK
jgi:hypothetical protein